MGASPGLVALVDVIAGSDREAIESPPAADGLGIPVNIPEEDQDGDALP